MFGQCRVLMMAAAKTSSSALAEASAARPKVSKRTGVGLLKLVPVSPQLGKFVGAAEASRTDAVKKIWEYIKLNNLQNPANKKVIFCDEKLKTIFDGKDKVGFTEIAKLLSQHFIKSS